MRLHFRGDGQASPVIILHAFLGSLDHWRLFSRRLARDFDIPGAGHWVHTEAPEEFPVAVMTFLRRR